LYFGSDKVNQSAGKGLTRSDDAVSSIVGISFGSFGNVVSQFGFSDDVLGKDPQSVQQLVGRPSTIESNVDNIFLNYTMGNHSASHYVRSVLLDGNGKVISRIAFYYRD
jgi:hypothetical protein